MIDKQFIDRYLTEIKLSIRDGKYRIERGAKRKDNDDLFYYYVIDEQKVQDILLSLDANDFSEKLHNKHPGYEYELLYVFGKEIELLERFGNKKVRIPLYIKINKLLTGFVIVISFHKQNYPIKYYFK